MINLKNVNKCYGQKIHALKDVSLSIAPREFVSLVGQSGTGKSTLVKLLIAEESPTSGTIVVGGWDITRIRRIEVPMLRRQIGVVFQDIKLLERKKVGENVAFALQVSGAPRSRITSIVPKVLKIVGLEDKIERYPRQLSGGEQQRVALARSLVHLPKVLIADEPTGHLDAPNTREIIELLLRINDFGTTVLLVTHDREVVNNLRKRVITLDNGMVIGDQKVGTYIL
ncbi:MAG: cell division ATP-binding protein FtsE [Parcubacteria group bacterium CG08_land_8_20_14_0_20_48_21]|nr:MAG: cell division ATP-binding protein FtsE [Parcubacteria group bacterium CG2_30_48_51]PIS32961.1 MAG: cell division ATP-binding protein FtsE [Parcubacteria group bacterium CG08_land_8_20_14_0_20_48_21]PIW78884.1 MAG: cell division ATP-binding protein FtsE [Parcubacteria group bacterium CG_4_8_14_3_um_filter_48_16]PIY77928.1 MAG: cell division ATP-binding protein FtsE [Parcubacteria group bacterium CG_4_10_14_0_8_um_filter_48_154]PIZ78612.1 MAG: cell division ATP-binding protein FtsE [bacte